MALSDRSLDWLLVYILVPRYEVAAVSIVCIIVGLIVGAVAGRWELRRSYASRVEWYKQYMKEHGPELARKELERRRAEMQLRRDLQNVGKR